MQRKFKKKLKTDYAKHLQKTVIAMNNLGQKKPIRIRTKNLRAIGSDLGYIISGYICTGDLTWSVTSKQAYRRDYGTKLIRTIAGIILL